VVESDLGEYIIQLRGEPPAHIITPAVHLSRGQVGKTFHEKLNIPLTEDIPTLTSAARRILRQTFFESDIGISGVNFGIAENGGICLVTNEGNGRLVTTLPQVHIALMGIERLVPTMEDLALMLYLLPRSATGQKLSVYVNVIFSPRREGEIDGPDQRHLILVDNGRRALRNSTLVEVLNCIRCGACLNVCPVFQEIGGHAYVGAQGQGSPYPGPIGSIVSPGLFGISEFGHLARASSLCGACKEACPVDIDLPKLLLRVRAAGEPGLGATDQQPARQNHASAGLSLGLRVFTWLATSPSRFKTAQHLAGVFGGLLSPSSNWLRLPAFTGWGYKRDFPRPAKQPFRTRFSNIQSLPPASNQSNIKKELEPPKPENPATDSPIKNLKRFEKELIALGGEFIRCNEENLIPSLTHLLQERSITSIQAWDARELPHGVLTALQKTGVQVQPNPDPAIKAGLTGALAGVAETGTLVLCAGRGRPMTASLLPEVHVAILRSSDIVHDLPQAFRDSRIQKGSNSEIRSSFVLISGPSRTADIEMTLTIGVHGPREVLVLCVE